MQRFIAPRRARFWTGFGLVLLIALLGFAWTSAIIPNWGSTPAERSRALPGDAQAADPLILWNHAITIQAPPEAVYPWLAQIGDTRGGFYSYTFIENALMRLAGLGGTYANTDQIHPEWQAPQAGQGVILNFMAIQDVQPGSYVIAASTAEMPGVVWTWLWFLEPQGADATRLIVRHRAQFPPEAPGGMVTAVFNAGYIMERGMLRGIRERAEGRAAPAPLEGLEIGLWIAALAIGAAAAARFVRAGDLLALGVGLAALVGLFIFTYIQPPVWLRLVLLLALAASLWAAYHPGWVSQRLRRAR